MTTSPPSTLKIFLIVAMVIFFWASSLVAIRIALPSYAPGSLSLFRYGVASIGMIFVYRAAAGKHPIHWGDVPKIFIAGVIGFGVYNFCLNYGEITVSAGIAGFIISQIPVVVVLLAGIFLKEKMSKMALVGMFISFIGVALIALSHQHPTGGLDVGILFLLIAVISAGTHHVMFKHLLHRYNAIELTAYGIWSGTFALMFFAPDLWHEIPHATVGATCAVIYMGIFPGLIGYVSWYYVLRYVSASGLGSALYAIPILATILGWLCLREVPALLALIGGLAALGGAVMLARVEKKKS